MFAFGDEKWPGLAKLVEECGEVLEVCGKLMNTRGHVKHWDGSDLGERLHVELADLVAAVSTFVELNGLDSERIIDRAQEKVKTFVEWHSKPTG